MDTLCYNWYNRRLDPQRDCANFAATARNGACPISFKGENDPDRYLTTNRATYKYPSKPIDRNEAELAALTKTLYNEFSSKRITDGSTTGIACNQSDGWLVAPSPIPSDGTELRRLYTTTHTAHGGAYSAFDDNRTPPVTLYHAHAKQMGHDEDGITLDITEAGATDGDALTKAMKEAAHAQEIAHLKRQMELSTTAAASIKAQQGATRTRRRPYVSVHTKKQMTCEAHISAIESRPVSHMAVLGGEQLKLRGDPKSLTAVQRAWTHNPLLSTLKSVAHREEAAASEIADQTAMSSKAISSISQESAAPKTQKPIWARSDRS